MNTQWVYRVLLLYPESRRETVEAWYTAEFPDAGELLTPIGTKDGENWYVSAFVATKDHVERWVGVMGETLGQPVDASFLGADRDTQRATFTGIKQLALQHIGIHVDGCFNDLGEMADLEAGLAAMGIERLVSEEV